MTKYKSMRDTIIVIIVLVAVMSCSVILIKNSEDIEIEVNNDITSDSIKSIKAGKKGTIFKK